MSDHVLYQNRIKQGLFAIQCAVTQTIHNLREGFLVRAFESSRQAMNEISALQHFIENGDKS